MSKTRKDSCYFITKINHKGENKEYNKVLNISYISETAVCRNK